MPGLHPLRPIRLLGASHDLLLEGHDPQLPLDRWVAPKQLRKDRPPSPGEPRRRSPRRGERRRGGSGSGAAPHERVERTGRTSAGFDEGH